MNTRLGNFCNKVIETGCLLSLIIIPLLFNPYAEQPGRTFEGSRVFILRSITLVMILAWVVQKLETGNWKSGIKSWKNHHPLAILTAILATFYFINSFISPYFPVTLKGFYLRDEGFYTFFSYIIIFFLIIQTTKKQQQLDLLITGLVLSSIPITFYGILQHFGIDPIWKDKISDRVTGTFGGPIFMGAYLIMVIPLVLSRLIENIRRIPLNICYGVILLLQLSALYFTKSRGPAVGFVAAITLFILIITARRRIKWVFISIIAIMIILTILLIPSSPLSSLKPYLGRFALQSEEASNTIKVRFAIWKSAETALKAQPTRLLTGYGFESIYPLYFKYNNPDIARYEQADNAPDHSHNDTFDLLVTGGISGLLIFMTIIILAAYYVFKYLGLIPNKSHQLKFYGCIISGLIIALVLTKILAEGIILFGLGIPGGVILGLGVYLLVYIFSISAETRTSLTSSELLLIGLLCGIIAHFIEIQFGMGLTTTRLYLWGFIGLIVGGLQVPTNESKPEKKEKEIASNPFNKIILWSVISGLIIAVMAFSLVRLVPNTTDITFLPYMGLFWIITLVFGGIIVLPWINASSKTVNMTLSYGLYIILSSLWSGLFVGIKYSMLTERSDLGNYITLLCIWIILNALIIIFFMPSGLARKLAGSIPQIIVYVVITVITFIFMYNTNLKELYAEVQYKYAKLVQASNMDKSVEYYQKSIQMSPQTDYYYEDLSDAYFAKGNYAKSIETLETLRKTSSYNPRIVRKLTTFYRNWFFATPAGHDQDQRYKKAIQYYQLLTTKYSLTNPVYFREWGDMLKFKQDYEEARKIYQKAIDLSPSSPSEYLVMGDLYKTAFNDENNAVSYYEKAWQLGGSLNTRQAAILCGNYFTNKRYEEFLKLNTILINMDSANYQHHFYAAQAYEALKKKKEALGEAKVALNLAPQSDKEIVNGLIKRLEQ
ncbi:MAG: O-antigen ligase family protein [Planctomycetes bacterium]|nr:O-antigen ligase family protein [Planctomycetota bacterium]